MQPQSPERSYTYRLGATRPHPNGQTEDITTRKNSDLTVVLQSKVTLPDEQNFSNYSYLRFCDVFIDYGAGIACQGVS